MNAPPTPPAQTIEALRAALAEAQAARLAAEARATGAEALVAHLKLEIAKLRRDRFGAQGSRMKDCDPLRGPARKKPRLAKPRFDRPTSNWSERIPV